MELKEKNAIINEKNFIIQEKDKAIEYLINRINSATSYVQPNNTPENRSITPTKEHEELHRENNIDDLLSPDDVVNNDQIDLEEIQKQALLKQKAKLQSPTDNSFQELDSKVNTSDEIVQEQPIMDEKHEVLPSNDNDQSQLDQILNSTNNSEHSNVKIIQSSNKYVDVDNLFD